MMVKPLKRLGRVTTALLGLAWWMLLEPIKKLFELMGGTTTPGLVRSERQCGWIASIFWAIHGEAW